MLFRSMPIGDTLCQPMLSVSRETERPHADRRLAIILAAKLGKSNATFLVDSLLSTDLAEAEAFFQPLAKHPDRQLILNRLQLAAEVSTTDLNSAARRAIAFVAIAKLSDDGIPWHCLEPSANATSSTHAIHLLASWGVPPGRLLQQLSNSNTAGVLYSLLLPLCE